MNVTNDDLLKAIAVKYNLPLLTVLLLTPLGSMHGKSGDPAKADEYGVGTCAGEGKKWAVKDD